MVLTSCLQIILRRGKRPSLLVDAVCNYHDQAKYGANDTFCIACGERWIPYISTPFDAKIPVKRVRKAKKLRHLAPSENV